MPMPRPCKRSRHFFSVPCYNPRGSQRSWQDIVAAPGSSLTTGRAVATWRNCKHWLLMNKSELFLIVVDEDRKQFTVEGPLADDRPWNAAIAAAQQEGRKIKCCNLGSASRAHAKELWQQHYGHFYQFVPPGRIVAPS